MKIRDLIFTICFLIIAQIVHTQSIDRVLRKYKNDEGVVAMSFAGDISSIISGKNGKMKSKIETCDVILFNQPNNVSAADDAKIKTAITAEKMEQLIQVKNKDVKARLYAVSAGDVLSKVFAVVSAENKNIYLTLTGKIYFDELSQLDLNFDGGDGFMKMFNK